MPFHDMVKSSHLFEGDLGATLGLAECLDLEMSDRVALEPVSNVIHSGVFHGRVKVSWAEF